MYLWFFKQIVKDVCIYEKAAWQVLKGKKDKKITLLSFHIKSFFSDPHMPKARVFLLSFLPNLAPCLEIKQQDSTYRITFWLPKEIPLKHLVLFDISPGKAKHIY